MEDLTKEHHGAPVEPTQTAVPPHHRFYHTRLWSLIRGEFRLAINGWACAECRGAETDCQCQQNPPATSGSVLEGLSAILDEFLSELQSYCMEEKVLTERMRTLRFTRSGLITALFMRTPPGAEKNVDITTLVEQALDIFDVELEVIRIELAERFATASNPTSNVKLVAHGAKSKIVDFANGLLRMEGMTTCDGTKLTFADMVRALGIAFNVDTPNLHIQRYQNRVRYKDAAQFLRRLAALVEKDADD